jgi:hypothetical protein
MKKEMRSIWDSISCCLYSDSEYRFSLNQCNTVLIDKRRQAAAPTHTHQSHKIYMDCELPLLWCVPNGRRCPIRKYAVIMCISRVFLCYFLHICISSGKVEVSTYWEKWLLKSFMFHFMNIFSHFRYWKQNIQGAGCWTSVNNLLIQNYYLIKLLLNKQLHCPNSLQFYKSSTQKQWAGGS